LRPLTPRQKDVLAAIDELTRRYGYPPTLREIARAVGLCLSTASYYVNALETKGAISRVPGTPRTIVVLHPDPDEGPSARDAGAGPEKPDALERR